METTPPPDPDEEYVLHCLKLTIEAAHRFWGGADPGDPETWPKNEAIKQWLREQEPCPSNTIVEKTCTIIRPEWAK
mgnify:CR=1 FL=1